jgi:hypothetical protein
MPHPPLFEYQGLDLRLTIWPGVGEVVEGAGVLRVPTATITQVERSPWNEEITLHTTEGRIYTCALPPEEIVGAQAALAEVMERFGGAPGPRGIRQPAPRQRA